MIMRAWSKEKPAKYKENEIRVVESASYAWNIQPPAYMNKSNGPQYTQHGRRSAHKATMIPAFAAKYLFSFSAFSSLSLISDLTLTAPSIRYVSK